jgi:eukaryotic-like serine/threonine-protein kinase
LLLPSKKLDDAMSENQPGSRPNGGSDDIGSPTRAEPPSHGESTAKFVSNELSETGDHDSGFQREDRESQRPPLIGRYEIRGEIGSGGFGQVYLAQDPLLNRPVALKIPRPSVAYADLDQEKYIEEARTAAQLEHPAIVAVHDVFPFDGRVVIVQQYVPGQDLRKLLDSDRLSYSQIADLMITIAEGMSFGHSRGFVHRDLKPSNILLDERGDPKVADFGLAIHEKGQQRRRGERSGTPSYMSPEQVRGETHRLDGRSDIWSLGVILYEMLTRFRPFVGDTNALLFEEIKSREPRPPRQINPAIPTELERICLKCLAKSVKDRYGNASDLADDLRNWKASEVAASGDRSEGATLQVVPKGLGSFDHGDSDFFLDLLPGPRDRDGLPESIRFWKSRVEERSADRAFAIGLISGPSGCGKSSLVKAGLLPQLAKDVESIYVEATADHTELRLRKQVRGRFSGIPRDVEGLADLFVGLREENWLPEGRKVLVVLDQFEQWLHAHRHEREGELLDALRQCDGSRVQCIILVRDDFWLAVSRLMESLEVDFVPGQNFAMVDLFEPAHARHVLCQFGQAFGTLPRDSSELTADQEEFLDRAVLGLAQENKVICVRLALFADMVKSQPWSVTTLKKFGGPEGLRVAFLEETFRSAHAPAAHRYHLRAARKVLECLLPDTDTDIRGHMRSSDELLERSGYARRPREFRELLRILERDLRLITPTDPEGIAPSLDDAVEEELEGSGRSYYHLTHDYLVPPLRKWLASQQGAARRLHDWMYHSDRIRTAGIVTMGVAMLFFVLHAGIIMLSIVFAKRNADGPFLEVLLAPGTKRSVSTMLGFIAFFDVPYFLVGVQILNHRRFAILVAILIDLTVIGLGVAFLAWPSIHPLYTGSADAVIGRWIVIAFIVGSLILYHALALLAWQKLEPSASNKRLP